MKSILIAGYYGAGNLGDEAILTGILAGLRESDSGLSLRVLSWNPEETAASHQVHSLHWQDIPGILDAADRSDLIIVGGGGIFQDHWGIDPESYLRRHHGGITTYGSLPLLGELLEVPCMLYGVGVGPLQGEVAQAHTLQTFERCQVATLRDQHSYDLLQYIGFSSQSENQPRLIVTGDPAFYFPSSESGADQLLDEIGLAPGDPLLGVSVRYWDKPHPPEDWLPELAQGIQRFMADAGDFEVLLLPFQINPDSDYTNDLAICRQLKDLFPDESRIHLLKEVHPPQTTQALLGRCSLVLGMRLHALILAMKEGVPVVGLPYDPKVKRLMAGAELTPCCAETYAPEAGECSELLMKAWTEREQLREKAGAFADQQRDRVRKDPALAVRLIHKSAPKVTRSVLKRFALQKVKLVDSLDRKIADLSQEVKSRNQKLMEKEQVIRSLQSELRAVESQFSHLQKKLKEIKNSRTWKLALFFQKIRHAALPPGSLRERVIRAFLKPFQRGRSLFRSVIKVWRNDGFLAVLKGIYYKIAGLYSRMRLNRFFRFPKAYADYYTPVDNSQVILYTEDESLFPDYPHRRSLEASGKESELNISLIATVYNESRRVQDWMESILNQTLLPDEIVIVDAKSSDDTVNRIRAYDDRTPVAIRVIEEDRINIAQGRNIAIQEARHPLIVASDFGCRPWQGWLEKITSPFRMKPETEVAAGFYRPVNEKGELIENKNVPSLERVNPASFVPSSRSIAFRKSCWKQVGGYPEWLTLTAEDTYFALELKSYCLHWAFVPDAVVDWIEPGTWWDQVRKAYSWSSGNGEIGYNAWIYRQIIKHLFIVSFSWLVGAVSLSLAVLFRGLGEVWAVVLGSFGGIFLLSPFLYYLFHGIYPWQVPADLGLRLARVLGFISGVKRRPEVTRRRLKKTRGVFLILAGVPIDDTGGGARCTQITLELLRRNYWVVYINQFPKWESEDAGVRISHPNLHAVGLEDFDWNAFKEEHEDLLSDQDVFALVEFPTPEFYSLSKRVKSEGGSIIYELIDDWDTDLGGDWYSQAVEQDLINFSDVLVATAPALQDRLEEVSGREVLLLPNAVNRFIFNPRKEYGRPPDYPDGEWSAIYIGALWGKWFDWELLTSLARAYPEAAVVVIGDYSGQCPDSPPNLHFLGLKPQTALPAYLDQAEVTLIPWKVNPITQSTSPLKLYEYLAMHKPVVTPELKPLRGIPGVYQAEDEENFIRLVDEVCREDFPKAEVEDFIQRNTWPSRVGKLLDYLKE